MRVIWIAFIVVFLSCRLLLAADQRPVGAYGAPDRLIIHTHVISPEAVRQALLHDWEVQVASAPTASLSDYQKLLQRKVQLGFQASGFLNIEGNESLDETGHIVIAVAEGPRFRRGPIQVNGAVQIPAHRLIDLLTHVRPVESFRWTFQQGQLHVGMDFLAEQEEPEWDTGRFADFRKETLDQLFRDISDALGQLGFFHCKFGIGIVPEAGLARLNINIVEEGASAKIASVQVSGASRNTPAGVIRYLGLAEGQYCGVDELTAAQRKLWDSGRFKKHLIDAAFTDADHSKIAIRIALEELPDTPTLDQPLAPLEEAAVKCGHWMIERIRAGDDVLLALRAPETTPPFALRATLGQEGVVSRIQFLSTSDSSPATAPSSRPAPADYAAVLMREKVALYAFPQRFVTPGKTAISGVISFSYAPVINPDGSAKWDLSFNAGVNTMRTGLKLKLLVAPVGLVELAHHDGIQAQVKDGIVTAQGSKGSIRIERATGRLRYFSMLLDGRQIDLSVGPGLLQAEADAADKAATGPNQFDPARPAESGTEFATEQFWAVLKGHPSLDHRWPGINRSAAELRLLAPPAMAILGQTFTDNADDPDPTFFIPANQRPHSGGSFAPFVLGNLPALDRAFARESWPWTLSRQMFLVYGGLTQSFQPEMERMLHSKQIGPIGYLIAAEWLNRLNPRAAVALAKIGLQHLSDDDFVIDVRTLTAGNSASATIVRQWAERLRQFPAADVKQVAEALPAAARIPTEQFIELLRSRRAEPIETALPAALNDVWTLSLRNSVKGELESLAPLPANIP